MNPKSKIWIVFLSWFPVFLISLNHIFRISDYLIVPTALCGGLLLSAIILTLICHVLNYIVEAFIIFIVFFIMGWIGKPFLEPPADPIDHLQQVYETCGSSSDKIQKVNGGLWHYSMNGIALCSEYISSRSPNTTLNIVRFLHSFMVALLATGLFSVAKSAGLSAFWAGFAVLITYLFMGTNRFGFFGYYSLADSSSSLLIYWFWVTTFYFKTHISFRHIILATFAACFFMPILYVNHMQEMIFLGFLCLIYLTTHLLHFILLNTNKSLIFIVIGGLFGILFILPQFKFFRDIISQVFIINDWDKNQSLVYYLGPIHLIGKIWAYRVHDTIGLIGMMALPAAIMIIWMSKEKLISYKIALIGILPLLVYCLPLLHYIWLSNCKWLPTHTRYYYRICYASIFGVTLSYFFFLVEKYIVNYLSYNSISRKKYKSILTTYIFRNLKLICLLFFIILSTIRSGPVYGKMDFLYMNNNPWWPKWRPMLEELRKNHSDKTIYTDGVTGFILERVFNYSILEKGPNTRKGYVNLDELPPEKKYYTLVNLKGFQPSWTARETGHWRPYHGRTSNFYTYKGESGNNLEELLKKDPLYGVQIFK